MRYIYSIARFVPAPARGEFINLGVLTGSEDAGDWALQTVSQTGNARHIDSAGALKSVMSQLTGIQESLDAFTDSRGDLFANGDFPEINEGWLYQLSLDSLGILQFTRPYPVMAESAQEAIDILWPELILEPQSRDRGVVTKHRIMGEVSRSLRNSNIGPENFKKRVRLEADNSHSQIDFAIHNGRVVQLTQCWSFQVADQEDLLDNVKAWAWTIRNVRKSGGRILSGDQCYDVAREVPIAAAYVDPESQEGLTTYEEAKSVFNDEQINAIQFNLENVATIGALAAEKLGLYTA